MAMTRKRTVVCVHCATSRAVRSDVSMSSIWDHAVGLELFHMPAFNIDLFSANILFGKKTVIHIYFILGIF